MKGGNGDGRDTTTTNNNNNNDDAKVNNSITMTNPSSCTSSTFYSSSSSCVSQMPVLLPHDDGDDDYSSFVDAGTGFHHKHNDQSKQQHLPSYRHASSKNAVAATTATSSSTNPTRPVTTTTTPGAHAVSRWGSENRTKGRITLTSSHLRYGEEDDQEEGDDNVIEATIMTTAQQRKQRRRRRIVIVSSTIVAVVITIVVIIILIILVFSKQKRGRQQQQQLSKEELYKRQLEYLSLSSSVSTSVSSVSVFDDVNSPQYKALQWVVYDDTYSYETITTTTTTSTVTADANADADDEVVDDTHHHCHLEIRYILALLYYSTTAANGGDDTHSWYNRGNFLSSNLHVCDWTTTNTTTTSTTTGATTTTTNTTATSSDDTLIDIICDDSTQMITGIVIERNNLHGTIPYELGSSTILSSTLTKLHLKQNSLLMGSIPSSLEKLTKLTSLDLSENNLHGTVPNGIVSNLNELQSLRLGYNKLEGDLFHGVQLLRDGVQTTLNELNVSNNKQLTGEVFSSVLLSTNVRFLTTLRNLTILDLSNCSFFGQMYVYVTCFETLQIVNIDDNKFGGWMPGVGSPRSDRDARPLYQNMEFFSANRNELSGTIPWEYMNYATNLHTLQLSGNELTGTLPDDASVIDNLYQSIETLDLSYNQFKSTISSTVFGQFTELKELKLQGNDLVGTIPSTLGSCTSLQHLSLNMNNGISGTLPTELSQLPSLDFVSIDDTNVMGDIEFLCPVVLGPSTNSTDVTASIYDDGGARIIADCAPSPGSNDDSPKVTCSCCICR